jgi:gliding motility-associated-like protein
MKKVLSFLLIYIAAITTFAQQGKDGAPSITTATTVNIYTTLSANVAAGATTITMASATGFSAGDLIYIIQMQGAVVGNAYVFEWGNVNNALPNDTSFGKVTAYNGAGNNEFAEINSISGNVITLNCALKDSFGINGKTQVIRVPRYSSLTLSGSGQITCPTWNGSTGGVVVIEVQGKTTLGSGTSINVAGMGFRGGAVLNASGGGATNTGSNFGNSGSNNGAHKGESIVGDTNLYKTYDYINNNSYNTPLSICKGNVANGGGGGNADNCGGGGGSNGGVVKLWNGMGNPDTSTTNNKAAWANESTTPFNGSFRPTSSSGGGRGGYAFSQNNADPTTTGNGPNNNGVWSGDSRHNDGGWGGIALDYSTGKLFLGGGGGAGDSNDESGTSGATGGGLFYLLSYGAVSGAGQILADGASALNTNSAASKNGDDGAGGGGGGGTVIINSTGNITLTNTLSISAQGGKGGNYQLHGVVSTQNFGPGGGGGGGYVATTKTVTGINVNGGINGIVVNGTNTTKISTKFPPNGATIGGIGTITTLQANYYLTAVNDTVCTGGAASLSVTVNGTAPSGLSILWYTAAVGSTVVYTGNPYSFTAPSSAGIYTYYASTCPGTVRIPVSLVVKSGAGAPTITITPTSSVVCTGASTTLTASGATSYTWSSNAGSVATATAIASPATNNTIYTVTGTANACGGGTVTSTQTIRINIDAGPTKIDSGSVPASCGKSNGAYVIKSITGGVSPYQLSFNGSAYAAAISFPDSVKGLSAKTYTLSVEDNLGCKHASSIIIMNSGGPTSATVTTVPDTCGRKVGAITNIQVTGGSIPYTFALNNTTYQATVLFNGLAATTQGSPDTIKIKDTNGCIYTVSTVTVGSANGVISVTVTPASDTCNRHVGTITITGGATGYSYSLNNGAYQTSSIFSGLGTGSDTVKVKANGCFFPYAAVITTTGAIIKPTITANGPTTFCAGDSVKLTASNALSYTWSTTGLNTQAITVKSGDTTYAVKVTSAQGCKALSDTVRVTVNAIPQPPIASDTVKYCQAQLPQALNATILNGATANWFNQNNNPLPGGAPTPSTSAIGNTIYSVKQTLKGCPSLATQIVVSVIQPPIAPIVNPSVSYCFQQPAKTLTATVTPGYVLVWQNANHQTIATPPNPTPVTTVTGTTTYYVFQNISGGCNSPQDTITITVNPKPSPNFNAVPLINISVGQSIAFTPGQLTSGISYSWNFEDPTNSKDTSSMQLPSYVYNTAGSYCPKLIVVNPVTGCKDSTTLCLDILSNISIIIPNVFSPNGDNVNDVFSIKSTGITNLSCDIFDRWGLKLYSWDGVNGYWDGSEKTGKAVDGTYFYVIQTTDVKGDDHKYNGFIQLIK